MTTEDSLLDDGPVVADLGSSVVGGGAIALLSQGIRFGLRTAGVVVMARLLTPDDFGVFVMATSLTMFASLFEDFGLTKATVQSPKITQGQVSSLFWINAGLGGALGLVTAAVAPLLAWYYGEPRVTHITMAMSIPLALAGLSVQHEALLLRKMRFRAVETIQIVAHVAGAVVMFGSAWLGAGYWSLALNIIVMRLVLTGMAWWYAGWRPGLPKRAAGVDGLLKFGGNLSGFHIVNFFNRNLDNILLGRYWGSQELGFYSKAYGLLRQPYVQIGGPISSVIVPALSRLQDDAARYRHYFLLGTKAVVFLAAPCVVFTYVDSREIVTTLLGAKWLPVVPLFRTLGPAALLSTTSSISGWLFQSTGRTDRMFKSALAVLCVMILAFVAGLPWGAAGVSLAYSVAYSLIVIPAMAYAVRGTPVKLRDVGAAVWPPFLLSILAGAATFAFKTRLGPGVSAARFVADGLVFCGAYAALWSAFPGGRAYVAELSRPVLERLRKKFGRGGRA